jgi:hypothetical protein
MKLAALLVPILAICAALVPSTASAQDGQVRHMVVFKFKPDATPEKITQVTDALLALKGKIPGIVSVEHGVNNSPEKKNLGFTHAFLVTFENAKARDAYLPHPEHKKFGALLGSLGVMEDVFVVDYVVEKK